MNKTMIEIFKEVQIKGKQEYAKYLTDEEAIKKIIGFDITAFQFVPEKFKTQDMCLHACLINCYAYLFIPAEYKQNRKIVLTTLSQDGTMLKYCPKSIKCNKEYVYIAMRSNPAALKYTDKVILEDKEFAKKVVDKTPAAIQYFPKFQNDPEVCASMLMYRPELKNLVGSNVIAEYEKQLHTLNYFIKTGKTEIKKKGE